MQSPTRDESVSYYCERCDVFGRDRECWLCGGPTVQRLNHIP